ncbi:hypothetical protein Tco_0394370 [Tanacetum coccineum]
MFNNSQTNNNNHLVQAINNQSFEINDIKVQLQDKTLVINELKHRLAQLHGKIPLTQCESTNFDSRIQKIKKRVSSFLGTSVNTKLSEPPTSGTKLYSVTPLPKSKVIPKVVEKNDLSKSVNSYLTTNKIIEKCTKVLVPILLKIESELINAYFENNRVMHQDYLNVTKEHVATLQELLE